MRAGFWLLALGFLATGCDFRNSEVSFSAPPKTGTEGNVPREDISRAAVEFLVEPTFKEPTKRADYNQFDVHLNLATPSARDILVSRKLLSPGQEFKQIGLILAGEKTFIDSSLEGGEEYEYSLWFRENGLESLFFTKKVEILHDVVINSPKELLNDGPVIHTKAYRFVMMAGEDGPAMLVTHRMAFELECEEFISEPGSSIQAEAPLKYTLIGDKYVPQKVGPIRIRAKRTRGELKIAPAFHGGMANSRDNLPDYAKDGAQAVWISVQNTHRMKLDMEYFKPRPENEPTPISLSFHKNVRPGWLDVGNERFFLVHGSQPITADAAGVFFKRTGELTSERDVFHFVSPGSGQVTTLSRPVRGDRAMTFQPLSARFVGIFEERFWNTSPLKSSASSEFKSLTSAIESIRDLNDRLILEGKWADIQLTLDENQFVFSEFHEEFAKLAEFRGEAVARYLTKQRLESLVLVPIVWPWPFKRGTSLYIPHISTKSPLEVIKAIEEGVLSVEEKSDGLKPFPTLEFEPFPD